MARASASDIRAGGAYFELTANDAALRRSLDAAQGKISAFSASAIKSLSAIAGAAGVGALVRSSIAAASNVEKVTAQFNVLFSGVEQSAGQWAKKMSASFGIGVDEIMIQLQSALVPMGFATNQAAELSKTMTRLAIDMGAALGENPAIAASALTRTLMGSNRALSQYGLRLSESTVKQEAMRLGMIGINDEMSQAQSAYARASLLIDKTSRFIGQASEQSNSWAQVTLRLREAWNETLEVIGEPLLKVFKPMIVGITGVIEKTRDWIAANPKIIEGFAVMAGKAVAAFAAIKAAAVALFSWALVRLSGITGHVGDALEKAGDAIHKGFGGALVNLYNDSLIISKKIEDIFIASGEYILAQMKVFGAQFIAFMKGEIGGQVADTGYSWVRRIGIWYGKKMDIANAAEGRASNIEEKMKRAMPPSGGLDRAVPPEVAERLAQLQRQADAAGNRVMMEGAELMESLGWDTGDKDRPKPPPVGMPPPPPGTGGQGGPSEAAAPTLPTTGVFGFMGARRIGEMLGAGRGGVENQQLDVQRRMLSTLEAIRDTGGATYA